MRSLALAQAWNDAGGESFFFSVESADAVRQKLREESISHYRSSVSPGSTEDVDWTLTEAKALGAEWIVLDGYHFDERFSTAVVREGFRLLTIDDGANLSRYNAECVLNQNPLAAESLYLRRDPETILLLGTRFALLRREFRRSRSPRIHRTVADRVLVTLGQSGQSTNVAAIVEGLALIGNLDVCIVGVEPTAIPRTSSLRIRAALTVPDMAELIEWADLVFTAAGSTCWEVAALERPMVVTVVAENQRRSAEGLHRAGAALAVSDLAMLTAAEVATAISTLTSDLSRREQLARAAFALVDGCGVHRVLERLRRPQVHVRLATNADCKTVYDWSSEAEVRAASLSSEPILWEDHQRWFSQRLSDANCVFLIGEARDGHPIGQVRFQVDGNQATISVSLAPVARGLGYGSGVIETGTAVLFSRCGQVEKIQAVIKPQNQSSIRAFQRADFTPNDGAASNSESLLFIRRR